MASPRTGILPVMFAVKTRPGVARRVDQPAGKGQQDQDNFQARKI